MRTGSRIPLLAPKRHFLDDYIDMSAEVTFGVTDLLDNAKRHQVKYVKLLGYPLLGMTGDSPDLGSLIADRGLLDVELKTSLFNLYVDLYLLLWKAEVSVGDEFTGNPYDQADFLATIMDQAWDDTTYEELGDIASTPVASYVTMTTTTPVYVIVTLGARNRTGSTTSGTVYARNLKALFSVGHLNI